MSDSICDLILFWPHGSIYANKTTIKHPWGLSIMVLFVLSSGHGCIIRVMRTGATTAVMQSVSLSNWRKSKSASVGVRGNGGTQHWSSHYESLSAVSFISVSQGKNYRGQFYSAQSTFKKSPGRTRQKSLATAGTMLTKPGAHNRSLYLMEKNESSWVVLG